MTVLSFYSYESIQIRVDQLNISAWGVPITVWQLSDTRVVTFLKRGINKRRVSVATAKFFEATEEPVDAGTQYLAR